MPVRFNSSPCPITRRRSRRRAFTLLELIATCLLLTILFTLIVPLLLTTQRQQQATDRRVFATTLASNLLERWTAREYADLNVGEHQTVELPADAIAVLPESTAAVSVAEESDGPPARRITVAVQWKDRTVTPRPVRLTGWVFQAEVQP